MHGPAPMHTPRRAVDLSRRVQYLPHMPTNRPLHHVHHHHGLTGRGEARVHE